VFLLITTRDTRRSVVVAIHCITHHTFFGIWSISTFINSRHCPQRPRRDADVEMVGESFDDSQDDKVLDINLLIHNQLAVVK